MTKEELAKPFSTSRFGLLLRNRLLEELPLVAIVMGIVLGLNLLGLLLAERVPMNVPGEGGAGSPAWTLGILLLGVWLASRSLAPMHGSRATEWILLPATGSEKYLAALAWILVAWPVAASAGAMALSALLAGLAALFGARGGNVWHPFTHDGLQALLAWWTVAPVLVAGSAFWRKHSLIRTLGTFVGTATAVGLLFMFAWFLAKGGLRGGLSFANGSISLSGQPTLERVLKVLLDLWCYLVLPVASIAFGWFRVQEKEARDAVQ